MYVPIPYGIDPYPYQKDALIALKNGKNILSVCHRRAGKDVICMQMLLLRSVQRVGTHLYIAPQYSQIRQIIWKGMDYDGKPFISAIPTCLITKKNEARMEIELFNGSRIIFAGSNNISGLIGTNPVTIIYSEFSLHNPMVRQFLNPILVQNNGIEVMNYTPRGRNHAYDVYETVRDNPKYFVQHLAVDQTFKNDGSRVITDEQVEDARQRGMSEEMIQQELYVSFDCGNVGSYYSKELGDMDKDGRICALTPDPGLPLHSCWDLGSVDSTAGLLYQVVGKYVHVLYLLHDTGKGLKHYLDEAEKYRESTGCGWGHHWMPHDVSQRHQGWEHTESRLMQARKYGWIFQMVPKVNFDDGIEATRYALDRIRIDKNNCHLAIRALREYQRVWDEELACYSPKPLQNWATHIADAFRYLAVNYKRLYQVHVPVNRYGSTL